MDEKKCTYYTAIFGLACLFGAEVIDAMGFVGRDRWESFYQITNVILLSVGVHGLFTAMRERTVTKENLPASCIISNLMVPVYAFVLNIDIFGLAVKRWTDILSAWHFFWVCWGMAVVLLLTDLGKCLCQWARGSADYLVSRGGMVLKGTEDFIKNLDKGVLFSCLAGILLWIGIPAVGNMELSNSAEGFLKWSLLFWGVWFLICLLIACFSKIIPRIGQVVGEMKETRILRHFMVSVIVLTILAVLSVLFPTAVHVFGVVASCTAMLICLIAALLYLGKKWDIKLKNMLWSDICMVLLIVLSSTFIVLPLLGSSTSEGQSLANSQQVEGITKLMELIKAGLDLITALL